MKLRRIVEVSVSLSLAVFLVAIVGESFSRSAAAVPPHPREADPHCTPVGGSIITNFGAIDQNTTMGTATGDLRGAVSGTLLGPPQQVGSNVVFHVQHHWVHDVCVMQVASPNPKHEIGCYLVVEDAQIELTPAAAR